jgi:NADH-ubiquinone oxidoreductase chain 4
MLSTILLLPLCGIFLIASINTTTYTSEKMKSLFSKNIALIISIINLLVSLGIYIIFDFSTNQYQLVQQQYELTFFDIYLGIDGISIYFVLLTTIIMPIALLSN